MNFISHRSDTADTSSKCLSDLRVEGPSEVVMLRSDDGGEFSEGKFGKLCKEMNIKQEFTSQQTSLSTTVLQNEGRPR